jgi:hypothetical protein
VAHPRGPQPMVNTYRTADDAAADKADLFRLMEALGASPSGLRRDEAGLWFLRGRPGCSSRRGATAKRGSSWSQARTSQQCAGHGPKLAFCEVTQDGDSEGCFRLHRLPTAAEAEEIRDILGIRKRMDLSAEARARLTARLPRRGTG